MSSPIDILTREQAAAHADEFADLREKELTSLRAALTSIKNRLAKGPVELKGWSVVAEQARREAEAALAEWES